MGKANFVARFVIEHFEVSIAPPVATDALFATDTTFEQAKELIKPQELVACVSKVTYGKAFYIFASSDDEPREFRALLDAALQQCSMPLKTQGELLKQRKVHLIVVGIRDKPVDFESVSLEALNELIKDSVDEFAQPVSYVLRYLKNNQEVLFPITTCHEIVSYEPQTR